ncbi:MAG: hypothetical protein IKE55_07705 [Kiritimatiellae bacterium]|nr:hypothetical protein [Kiritimatiellia bacterium]
MKAKAMPSIGQNVLCFCATLLSGGFAQAAVYTDSWTEGAMPASSHNGYIAYAYHTDSGIKSVTVNPPADGDVFVFTGGKIKFMDNAAAATVSASKKCKVVFQNDVWIRNFTMTAPAAPAVVTNHFYRNLVGTEYVTVLANANLDDYEPVSILQDWKDERNYEVDPTSGQHWLNRAQTLNPNHLVRGPGKMTFQYQTARGTAKNGRQVVKVIKAELKQVGADVKIRAVAAYSAYSDAPDLVNLGFDVDALWIGTNMVEEALYTGGDTVGYGFNTVALKYVGDTFVMRVEGTGTQHVNSARPGARARIELADASRLEKASYPAPTGGTVAFLDGSYDDFRWYVNSVNRSSTGTFVYETTKPTSSPAVTNTIQLSSMEWFGRTPFVVGGIEGYPMLLNIANAKYLPTNSTVTAKCGGIVKLGADGSNHIGVKGGACSFVVEKGGVLQQAANYVFGTNTMVTLNGGRLQLGVGDPYAYDVGTDLPLATLRNGALIESRHTDSSRTLRIGRSTRGATWCVGGESPSTNNVAIQFYGPSNKTATNTFNVAKTGDYDADFVCNGGIGMYTGTTGITNVLRKIGHGTMLVKGNCTVPADALIEGGTFKLGASNIWRGYWTTFSTTSPNYKADDPPPPIVLCGGTFAAAANTSNGLGRVALAADSGLKLEEGACITCYDQSSVEWNPDARLNIAIPTNSRGDLLASVRFGTTANGLTESQLASIRVNGRKVALDKDGWIQKLGMTFVIR